MQASQQRAKELQISIPSTAATGGLLAKRQRVARSQTPCRGKPRTGAGTSLPRILLFEESPQIDAADGGRGGIKTITHLDLLAHLLDQLGRNVERFRLAVDQGRNLILDV